MPIEISCSSCSKRLRVPDNAAGKRVKCPKCQTIISVPASAGSSVAGGSSSKVAAGGRYHMKTEDGQTFGPVPKNELDEWVREGRITAECQLLKEGADQWQWATDLFPQLDGGEEETVPATGSASGGFPNLDTGGSSGAADNPFSFAADDLSPSARVGGGRRKSGPTRSTASSSSHSSPAVSSGGDSGELSDKSKMVAGLLGIFLGGYGVGRFYLGYTNIGLLQLFTCGGCGIWAIIDAIQIFSGNVPDARGRKLRD